MTDESRADFHDEPTKECRECGEPCLISELDERGLCYWCVSSEDLEEDW